MEEISKKIIFFGSGPVAAACLERLHKTFKIEAVVTKPRAAHHRGSVPVIECAARLALPIKTVTDKQSLNNLFDDCRFTSRLAILIDFGIIVSQEVIDKFELGIINSHFSLLPRLRGADPITFAILQGDQETGVSLMKLVAGMDEGPILGSAAVNLDKSVTTPILTAKLIDLSDELIQRILPLYIEGKVSPLPQQASGVTYSRKLTKSDSLLDWTKPAEVLEREVRAFIEWPKSKCRLGGHEITITSCSVVPESGQPGKTFIYGKLPAVYCGKDALVLDRVKPNSKKEMGGQAFLAGYKAIFTD